MQKFVIVLASAIASAVASAGVDRLCIQGGA